MLDWMTGSVTQQALPLPGVLLCTIVSLALGVGIACVYMTDRKYTKGFVVTLALLPVTVQLVISLVNGNLGAGVAVAGAFSLVRFRSVPGSAKDIGTIFFAMAVGLATGMGYLFYAVLFFAVVGLAGVLLTKSSFGRERQDLRVLKITVPETLDYEGAFDDLLERYTDFAELERVKTTSMGSLFELSYQVRMKDTVKTKQFLDELRCRNGNLSIMLGRPVSPREEL